MVFNTPLLCLVSAHQWKEQWWGTGQAGTPTERNTWALVSLGTRSDTNWFIGSSIKFLFNSPWNTHSFSLTGNHQPPLVALRAIYFEQSSWNQKMGKAKEMLMCFFHSFSVVVCLTPAQTAASASLCPALSTSSPARRNTAKPDMPAAGKGWFMVLIG